MYNGGLIAESDLLQATIIINIGSIKGTQRGAKSNYYIWNKYCTINIMTYLHKYAYKYTHKHIKV